MNTPSFLYGWVLILFLCSITSEAQDVSTSEEITRQEHKWNELRNYMKWSYNYATQKKFDSANKYVQRANHLALEFEDPNIYNYSRGHAALISYWQIDTKKAKDLLKENLGQTNLSDSIKVNSWLLFGEVLCYEKEYKEALPYYIKATALIEKRGVNTKRDSVDLTRGLVSMALLHKATANFSKAHTYFDKAVQYALEANEGSYIMFYKAGLYEEENKLREAIEITKRSVAVATEHKGKLFLPTYYLALSTYYKKLQNGDSAIYFGKKGVMDNEDCQLDLLHNAIGDGYVLTNNYKKASHHYHIALEELVSTNFEVTLHKNLRDTYEHMGEYRTAMEHNRQYLHLKDSLDALKVKQEVMDITEKYESNKKQLEIETLNVENVQKNVLIAKQRSKIALISLGLFSALCCMGLVYYFYIRQKRQRQVLFLKNGELARQLERSISFEKAGRNRQEPTEIDQNQRTKIRESIDHLIENEFYLDTEISLTKMARMVETNTSYLSKVINEDYKKTFVNFINELRLSHTLRAIEYQPGFRNLTIEHIADKSGFASPSTFYSAFKKYTGLTPSYYIKQRLRQSS